MKIRMEKMERRRNMSKGKMYVKRCVLGILALMLVAGAFPPVQSKAADDETGNAKTAPTFTIKSKDNKVPTFKAGESKEWKLVVTNNSKEEVENVIVTPQLGDDSKSWPFETEEQDYSKNIGTLPAGHSREVAFKFKQREDVPTDRYTLLFTVSGDGTETQESKFYINTTAKPEEKKQDENKPDDKQKNTDKNQGNTDGQDADVAAYSVDGGVDNGDVSYAGGDSGSSSSGSVPRVIVTGFTTDPTEVHAGQDFTLTVHLKNTSKTSNVQNMLFELTAPTEGEDAQTSAPAFLPTSGSDSVYLDGIGAGGNADIAIKLNAKSDLLQKPYSISLAMKYEDANNAQVEGTSNLSIPVKQDARFELSEFQISPETVEVGNEADIMCSLYNLGRIKLYNVKAVFEGASIEKEEVFVGNVESGATASIDAMVTGKKATNGPAKVTMTLSYEDESGKVKETKKDLQLEVTEAVDNSTVDAPASEEETSGGFPVLPVVIVLVIIAIAVTAVVITKKNKKKKLENEEEALLDELDRPSEDEQQ